MAIAGAGIVCCGDSIAGTVSTPRNASLAQEKCLADTRGRMTNPASTRFSEVVVANATNVRELQPVIEAWSRHATSIDKRTYGATAGRFHEPEPQRVHIWHLRGRREGYRHDRKQVCSLLRRCERHDRHRAASRDTFYIWIRLRLRTCPRFVDFVHHAKPAL